MIKNATKNANKMISQESTNFTIIVVLTLVIKRLALII